MGKILEITIPTELKDITLIKYQQLKKFIADDKFNDIELSIKLISLMCDITKDDVRALKVDEFNGIIDTLHKTLNSNVNYVKPPNFKLGEIEYGFIPNLDEMTFGEYVDLDTFIKDTNDLNKVMAVLYRPITHQSFGKYRIEEYTGKEDWEVMDDAPMDAVDSSLVFFYNLGKELSIAMKGYLERAVKQGLVSKKVLGANGAGINQSMELLKETLESSMKRPVFQFTKR